MKTLVLGLGNPLLSDDGVGWRVAELVQAQIANPDIEIDFHSGGGLSLMERLIGYDRAIIIDALNTGRAPQGTVSAFRLEDLPNDAQSHLASAHETTLQTALQVGRTMGAALPNDILIVAVEAQNVYDFSEELSPAVASAVPKAVELVIRQLGDQVIS
jgi:hydrogenase maturation protease